MLNRILAYLRDGETRFAAFLFLLNAFIYGMWSVRLPDVQKHLSLSDAQLGLTLFAIPLGVVVFSLFTGWAMDNFGTGKVAIVSGIIQSTMLAAMPLAQSMFSWVAILFVYGIVHGALDISMNGVVTAIEKKQNRILMSTAHGFWSLGAMAAAFGSGFIAGAAIPYQWHFLGAGLFALAAFLAIRKGVWNLQHEGGHRAFRWVWPGNRLVLLIVIVFIVFMVEGGIGDWAALFYEKILGSPEYLWGFGFGTFSAAMALARFNGDQLLAKYNDKVLLVIGCGVAAVGLLLFSLGTSFWLSTGSMVLTGLACSVLVPIVFREAGNGRQVTPGLGLALVGTLGYSGFLIGPPIMGYVSEAYGLKKSFLLLAILIALAGTISLFLKNEPKKE